MHARRLVAQRCIYGVDKNPFAVNLAKLSLWLVTLARDLPFTFLDHSLRCGDSLVGLSLDQVTRFHWEPAAQIKLVEGELRQTLAEAVALRRQICNTRRPTTPRPIVNAHIFCATPMTSSVAFAWSRICARGILLKQQAQRTRAGTSPTHRTGRHVS